MPPTEASNIPGGDSTDQLSHLLRLLRRSHEGLLACDGLVDPVRYTIHPLIGAPVLPVGAHALQAESVTLHIPDESPDALHLIGRMTPIDPNRDGACDRWLACFGKPATTRWGVMEIEAARRADFIVDGDQARLANPLASSEGAICKRFNADPTALSRLAHAKSGVDISDPRLVGVDPFGIDIRARFGVVRIEFDSICATPDEATSAVASLIVHAAGRTA